MPEQSSRIVQIKTLLPDDTHAVSALSGHEKVNELYQFSVTIFTDGDPIKPDQLLGQDITLTINYAGESRDINGVVAGMWQTDSDEEHVFEYELEVVPRLWILGMCTHNRVFTEMSALDIVKDVVQESCGMDISDKTTTTPLVRETCMQYGETDLDFVLRLLEDEGIAFYFEHTASKAKLVLVNTSTAFADCTPSTYPYEEQTRASFREPIWRLRRGGSLGVGKLESTDYVEWASRTPQVKTETSSAKAKLKPGDMQIYGRQNFKTDGQKRSFQSAEAKAQVGRWLDSIEPDDQLYNGHSSIPTLIAGHAFTLEDAPKSSDGVKDFLLLEVTHSASEGVGTEASYHNEIQCAPKSSTKAFLPDYRPESPRIWGVQSAKVMEEKTPGANALGEVKVSFHWDTNNQSCWARVAQLYAGNKWGGYFVPRLGQEVLVEFINGDPDRPVVVGAVYNQDNPTPPYKKWQSGIRSSKGRTSASEDSSGKSDDTYNELRFDDTSDAEEVYFQAQKDHNFLVKNNETGHIKGNQDIRIGDEGKGDQKLAVDGNQIITVGTDGKGDQKLTIEKNQNVKIGADSKGNQKVEIGGNQNIDVGVKQKNGKIEIEAGKSITLKVGKTKIVIDQTSITLDAPQDVKIKAMKNISLNAKMDVKVDGMNVKAKGKMNINLEGGMAANMKGTMVDVKASAMGKVSGSAMLELKGGMVMVN